MACTLIVGVYVDDLIITRGDMEVLGRFKKEMSKNFKMSDLGMLSYYLGIEVQQNSTDIFICQSAYAMKLLNTFGLADSNPTRTPMEAQLQLRRTALRRQSTLPITAALSRVCAIW